MPELVIEWPVVPELLVVALLVPAPAPADEWPEVPVLAEWPEVPVVPTLLDEWGVEGCAGGVQMVKLLVLLLLPDRECGKLLLFSSIGCDFSLLQLPPFSVFSGFSFFTLISTGPTVSSTPDQFW